MLKAFLVLCLVLAVTAKESDANVDDYPSFRLKRSDYPYPHSYPVDHGYRGRREVYPGDSNVDDYPSYRLKRSDYPYPDNYPVDHEYRVRREVYPVDHEVRVSRQYGAGFSGSNANAHASSVSGALGLGGYPGGYGAGFSGSQATASAGSNAGGLGYGGYGR